MEITIVITVTTICQIISVLVYDERLLGSNIRIIAASIISFSIDLDNSRHWLEGTLLLSMQIGYLFFTDYRIAYTTFVIHSLVIYYINLVQRDDVLIKSRYKINRKLSSIHGQKVDGTTYAIASIVDNLEEGIISTSINNGRTNVPSNLDSKLASRKNKKDMGKNNNHLESINDIWVPHDMAIFQMMKERLNQREL